MSFPSPNVVRFFLLCALPSTAGAAGSAQAPPAAVAAEPRWPMAVHYTIAAKNVAFDGESVTLDVTLEVVPPPQERTVVAIPVWTPGSYRLRPFPERIHGLTAGDGGERTFAVQQLDAQTWQVQHGPVDRLVVRYRVDLLASDRFMLRGTLRRCLTYEGPAVYLYLRDHLRAPCYVRFDIPGAWSVASGLLPLSDGRHFAADYDVLADCPVKLGMFQRFDFASHDKKIEVVVDGPGDVEFDSTTWLANIKKVVDVTGAMFGELPFDRYVFLFTASPGGGGGGLEHLYSTCIGVPVTQLRNSPRAGMSTIAHEFFHTFNVKRLRPAELGPFDYSRPNRTDWLWLMEGVTSYYAQVLLARADLLTADAFWRAAARRIASFESAAARHAVSSAQASDRVWDNEPSDRTLDYYNSGEVLGLLLDLEIRGRTGNRRSLDDVMRALYRLCVERGRGFERDDVTAIAGAVAGCDLRAWFDLHVFGTVVPDYPRILGYAGLTCTQTETTKPQLRGLQSLGDSAAYANPDAATRGRIDARAGRILTVDDVEAASMAAVEAIVATKAPGDALRLKLQSLAGEVEVRASISARVQRRVQVKIDDAPPPAAMAVREGITRR